MTQIIFIITFSLLFLPSISQASDLQLGLAAGPAIVRVKAFGQMAEKCVALIQKDARVYVRGSNRREIWKDKNDQPHSRTVVIINDLMILDAIDPANTATATSAVQAVN